jgi:hypothetical protein
VLIFSTHTFDASQIDVSSIMFGPAYVAPISSKLVPAGMGESIGLDESAEWEKMLAQFDPNSVDRKNIPKQNLLLIFDVASLDVQCHLDQALFLRGTTTTGQQIVGGVSTSVVGCGPNEIGTHKHSKIPHRWWPVKQRKPKGP